MELPSETNLGQTQTRVVPKQKPDKFVRMIQQANKHLEFLLTCLLEIAEIIGEPGSLGQV